jgi:hypothetical protein
MYFVVLIELSKKFVYKKLRINLLKIKFIT